MTRWRSCLYRPDLTASAPSRPNRWPPSSSASLRKRLGSCGRGAAVTATTTMGPRPTVTWRRGSRCPSSTGTSRRTSCPPHWRTWTPSTATRRSVTFWLINLQSCTSKQKFGLTVFLHVFLSYVIFYTRNRYCQQVLKPGWQNFFTL